MKKIITILCIACCAITVHAQSTGDYQSIKSGNWTDITVWQRYNGSKWVAAAAYPTSADGVISVRDLTTVTINANLAVDQTIVDAGGQLNLVANYTVSLNNTTGDDLIINGAFNWTSGTIDGAGSVGMNGTLSWTGGNLKVSLTSQGSVTMYNVYLYPTSVFTNNGTANSYTAGNMIVFAGGKFTNNNIFNAYGNGTFYNSTGGGTFLNTSTGIFNVQCTEYITNNIIFTNKGVMNFIMGSFYNYSGTFTNTKTMNFSGGGYQNRGAASIEKGSKITGNGYISLNSFTMSFNIAVALPAGITVNIYGNSNLAGTGSVTLNGILNWHQGSISVPFTIGSQGVAYIYNSSGYLYKTLTNNGTINWNGYDLRMYDGSVINNKTFNINSGSDNIIQYNTTHPGSFVNSATGTVTKTIPGSNTIGVAFANKGTITGIGTFAFGTNLTNNGTFDPGLGTATGILTTGTDFKNEVLSIRITGSNPGLDFDRLVVTGNAAVGTSTLKVTAAGSVPAGSYVILSCTGTRTGTFSTTTLPAGYTLTYKTNQVILNVPAPLIEQALNEADVTAASLNSKLLSLSPNPAFQNLNISFQSKNKSATLKIFDESGKPLLQKTVSPSISNNINISKLTPGSYIVQLNDGELTRSAKFIKQ